MTLGAYFRRLSDKLLDAAVAAESRQAKLASQNAALSCGSMRYFYRRDNPALPEEAIVMIHGAGSDKSSWVRLAAHLHTRYSILIPDLPGHGDSPAGLGMNLGITAQAERLRAFFAAVGIKRAHLIGNSMGGAIALHLAATSPDLINSLVLIDAAGTEARPGWLRTQVAAGSPNPMLDINNAADFRRMIKIGMEAPPYMPGILMGALARRYAERKQINARIERDVLADLDQRRLLDQIKAATLIIWGEQDRVLHVDDAELLRQRIRNSSKVVLAGVGHVPMVEAPKQVASLCKHFYEDAA